MTKHIIVTFDNEFPDGYRITVHRRDETWRLSQIAQ